MRLPFRLRPRVIVAGRLGGNLLRVPACRRIALGIARGEITPGIGAGR